jgi:hypothetical protein
MMTFEIEPYVGVLPLRFGMTSNEVAAFLGAPLRRRHSFRGNSIEEFQTISVCYAQSDNGLNEVGFAPETHLFFRGQNLFSSSDAIAYLRQFDPVPWLWVGFVVFLELGIQLSGFHDNDESQLEIAVMRRGYWDQYRDNFMPLE